MAAESAQLGVPGIFVSSLLMGTTDELTDRYRMLFRFDGGPAGQADALDCAESILADPQAAQTFRQRHQQMMAEQIDVTAFIADRVARYARREAV
jgi:predicted glycosyltransferase